MASDVTINNALDFSQSSANSSAQLAEDFDDFLILLTTQLQNQDPLDPADSTEFTNQLVAFAGVEQQINTNQRLESLVSLGLGTSFSSALNYVGKDINYISGEANYDGQTPIDISYAISGASTDTRINIFNDEGVLIYSETLSDEVNGKFTWEGTNSADQQVEAGTYQIRIDALDENNEPLETTTVVSGYVSGVETQNGTTYLLVGERAVSVGNVINVQEATTTQADNSTDTETEESDSEETSES